jgi:hypothetical protein
MVDTDLDHVADTGIPMFPSGTTKWKPEALSAVRGKRISAARYPSAIRSVAWFRPLEMLRE